MPQRDFPGKAWVINTLRVAHLVGVIGIGAPLVGGPVAVAETFWLLLLAGGAGIFLLDLWAHPGYLAEVKGATMVLKLLLAGLWGVAGEWRAVLFWTLVAVSVLVAHAPSRVRGRRWLR